MTTILILLRMIVIITIKNNNLTKNDSYFNYFFLSFVLGEIDS